MELAKTALKFFKIALPASLAALVFLGSCSSAPAGSSASAAQSGEPVQQCPEYRVCFRALGSELVCMDVKDWSRMTCPIVPQVEGLYFMHWTDEEGNVVEPELEPIRRDVVYTAVYAPVLDRHVPYLFADEFGLLRPDAPLDNTELLMALDALAAEAARPYFPELTETGGAVSGAALRKTLSCFFHPDVVNVAMASCGDSCQVSRSQFARIMNQLLGRSGGEAVTVAADQLAIPDVSPARSDYSDLMEAAVEHGRGEGALPWNEIEMQALYEPGFVLLDGWLYWADEDGYLVSDTLLGSLTFGYDGKFTSGDPVLDGYVSAVLKDLSHINPGSDREQLLRYAYDYVRDSFSYLRKNTYSTGAVGWQLPDATSIFECGQGSCYGYAAAFWALARGLGYEAEALSGAIGRDMQPHAWVEIEFDGTVYIFDPFTESELIKNGEIVRDMFMLHPDTAWNWLYYRG